MLILSRKVPSDQKSTQNISMCLSRLQEVVVSRVLGLAAETLKNEFDKCILALTTLRGALTNAYIRSHV